jgi:hypothetical protein
MSFVLPVSVHAPNWSACLSQGRLSSSVASVSFTQCQAGHELFAFAVRAQLTPGDLKGTEDLGIGCNDCTGAVSRVIAPVQCDLYLTAGKFSPFAASTACSVCVRGAVSLICRAQICDILSNRARLPTSLATPVALIGRTASLCCSD